MNTWFLFLLVAGLIELLACASWDSSEEINQEGLVNTIVNTVNKRSENPKLYEFLDKKLETVVVYLERLYVISAVLLLVVGAGLIRDIFLRQLDKAKENK